MIVLLILLVLLSIQASFGQGTQSIESHSLSSPPQGFLSPISQEPSIHSLRVLQGSTNSTNESVVMIDRVKSYSKPSSGSESSASSSYSS